MSNAETPRPSLGEATESLGQATQASTSPGQQAMPSWPPVGSTGPQGHPGPQGQHGQPMYPQQQPYPPQQPYPGYPQYPQYPGYQPQPPQENGPSCLIVIALLSFVAMVMITIGLLLYVFLAPSSPDDGGSDPVGTRFDADVRVAMLGPEAAQHAVYLEKLMRAKAGIIEADALAEGDAEINTHAEVMSLIRKFGRFGVSGTEARIYPGLPAVADKAITLLFTKDKDGNVQGGDFTAEERRQAVILFNEMADAFKKIQ